MSILNKAFAEYATRVSFNLTLSRNQAYVLCLVARQSIGKKRDITGFPDMFVPGVKGLQERGLLAWTDPSTMKPKWSRFPYELTDAGKHVYALLQMAGVASAIPESHFDKRYGDRPSSEAA